MATSPRARVLTLLLACSLTLTGCGSPAPWSLPAASDALAAAAKPELTLTITPASGDPGTLVTLAWQSRHADSVTIEDLGEFRPEGTHSLVLKDSATFTAVATGEGGEASSTVTFSLTRPKRPARHPAVANPINHIVMMFQENRSFDNYFSAMNAYRVANGLPADVAVADPNATNPTFDQTGTIARFKMVSMCHENVSPAWNESHVQIDLDYQFKPAHEVTTSRMNGFVYTGAKYARDVGFLDTEGRRAMGYYDHTDLPYYYFMAVQFGISDMWFSPAPTKSAPNRMFQLAGTSNGYVNTPLMDGVRNIFQVLEERGISWKIYYTDTQGGIPVSFITYFDAFYQANKAKVVPVSQYFTDLENGTLPAVAMIESGYGASRLDEHPSNNIQTGAAYVASLINALMNSSSWKDSVFILSYDESGGLYDSVPPPAAVAPDDWVTPRDTAPTDIKGDFRRYGMRVPNLVISPYSRPGYVSHRPIDHTAVLKFIQTRFDLPALTARDSSQSDMYDFFDFAAPPRLTPPTPPAQPTNGPCYYDRVP